MFVILNGRKMLRWGDCEVVPPNHKKKEVRRFNTKEFAELCRQVYCPQGKIVKI